MSQNGIKIIKIIIVYLLVAFLAYQLFTYIDLFVSSQDYFSLSVTPIVVIAALFLFVLYTVSLTVGHWQNIYSTFVLPAVLALLLLLLFSHGFSAVRAILIILSLLLGIIGAARSYNSKSNLIKFDAAFILRPLNKALLLFFSLYAGFSIYSQPELVANLNIGQKISQTVQGPMEEIIETQLNNTVKNQVDSISLGKFNLGDSELEKSLKEMGVEYFIDKQESSTPIIDVKQIVETQVNNLLDPYKSYFPVALSLIVFFLVNFYLLLGYYVYVLTIGMFIALAKWSGLLHTELKTVEQETLTF